jgi:hypothetical protein
MGLEPNKKCPICKKPFVQFNSMRQKVCGDVECAFAYGRLENQKKERKEAKKAVREFNQKNKKKSAYIKEAQASINKYVRLRDWFKPCISCGGTKHQIELDQGWKTGGCWDAGHFKTRGAYPELKFNLWNIHKQCKKCNGGAGRFSYKAKTTDERYEINLRAKIGDAKVDWLNGPHELDKFPPEYCERIKKIFNKKARILEKRLGLS